MNQADKVIQVALGEVGYLEKCDRSELYDKTANAGGKNFTKYWEDIRPAWQGQPWCAVFVTWVFVQAFGEIEAKKLLRHFPFVYCPKIATLFTQKDSPCKGDIVVFWRKQEFSHTGIVVDVSGDCFETVEGNTESGSSVIANGGGVYRKRYCLSDLPGTKFLRPNYEESEGLSVSQYEELKQEIKDLTDTVKQLAVQVGNLRNPMIYNYVDENMPPWARVSVQWAINNGLVQGDGSGLDLTDEKLWTIVVMRRLVEMLSK